MSQQATVNAVPTRALLWYLFKQWGYSAVGAATLGCNRNLPDTINVTSITWDGTNLNIVGTFSPSCSGSLDIVEFDLNGPGNAFYGYARISNIGVTVNYGQSYTIYYTEVLNVPSTATVTGP